MIHKTPKNIILASASAIRAEILTNAGIAFKIKPSRIDETGFKIRHVRDKLPVSELVCTLAIAKAEAVGAREDEVVIGADQVLELNGQIFDKPENIDVARKRLKLLRGRTHQLIGAVCILQPDCQPWTHVSTTKLTMRNFSDEFLSDYLHKEGTDVLASVGAYKFEGLGAGLFEKVEGDFFSILGLSLLPLMAELRQRGAIMV